MGVDLLSWLYPSKATQGAVEKTPGILVLGAELVCPCGTSHSYLNLNTEHLNIADLPQANVSDCIAIDNILPFGSCRRYGSVGWPCKKIMDLAEKWENSEPQTMKVNGEEVITTDSTLICYVSGREIYAVTSGQEKENQFAEYKRACEEIERDYPGLLAVLADPHGSVYLQDGMYELAIQFLEDYVKDAKGELLLAQVYDQKNPKDIFVVAALDRLLTDCDGSSFESLFNGLENTGCQTGMDQKEGWDIRKLNQQMIEMLRIDCKATAEKINTSSFARWTEEHKKFLNILGNTVLQLAYDVMLSYCISASMATRAVTGIAGSEGSKKTIQTVNELSDEQIEALMKYTGKDYININNSLRGISVLTPENQATVEVMKSTLNNSALSQDMILYRGTSTEVLGTMKNLSANELVGKQFVEKGFMSTSKSSIVADGFTANMHMTIEASKGVQALDISSISLLPEEAEVLFNAGQEMIIKSATVKDEILYITVTIP